MLHWRRFWRGFIPERRGVVIEDMDIFESAIVLYERHNGTPGLTVVPLTQGEVLVRSFVQPDNTHFLSWIVGQVSKATVSLAVNSDIERQ